MNDTAVLKLLEDEMEAAVAVRGLEIDMDDYGVGQSGDGFYRVQSCVVCAIGAVMIGKPHAADTPFTYGPAIDFARLIERPKAFGIGVSDGTGGDDLQSSDPEYLAGFDVGMAARHYALRRGWIGSDPVDEED